jgi:1-hydroxycarotenoid 3,4-desaturase
MLNKTDTTRGATQSDMRPVVIVGAGIGGLVCALLLVARGVQVRLVEKAAAPGGKLREVTVAGRPVDSGPTVFTMRWVFEAIFDSVGADFSRHVGLTRADILARHSWPDGSMLDLHADKSASADAIGSLAGAGEARGYLAFCDRTAEVFRALNTSFMENPSPNPVGLARDAGVTGLLSLTRIKPFTALSKVIDSYFRDPRLRQLFGRYATYCGSSPYQAPGPLMLIAHVEQAGVWLVDGGMMQIARALERLATERGAEISYGSAVSEIVVRDGTATGVRLVSGELIEAQAVVFNGDPGALFGGLLGAACRRALAPWRRSERSLSALTLSCVAKVDGFDLSRHTVFFGADYPREFSEILQRGDLPSDPTVYVCAQDRAADRRASAVDGEERLLLLVNAPARADEKVFSEAEIASCKARMIERLTRGGLTLSAPPKQMKATTPADFSTLFPGTGGALYGRASHGWAASFQRPGARTSIRGLFLAGGAVHPGPGIPMAALSGRFAAQAVFQHLGSTRLSRMAATPGGMSTRSATKVTTR